MSLETFKQRVDDVTNVRSLSSVEKEFVRTSKRLLINRFHAQQARNRTKQLITDLQEQVSELKDQVRDMEDVFNISRSVSFALLKVNASLEEENKALRMQSTPYVANVIVDQDECTVSF